MSTITLSNIRVSSDLTVKVRLKDGGVAIDWSTLSNIRALIYADAQRAMAGRCAVSIDAEDATLLVCQYAANKPQYIGVNRIVISATYMGEMKTYDKPALNFVRWTDDQAGQEITIDDPDVEVEIEVEDVSSSILQEAIAAALQAAEDAEHAAHLIPNQILLDCEAATQAAGTATGEANAAAEAANAAAGRAPYIDETTGNWFVWDVETGQYVDSGEEAQGPQGNPGPTPNMTIGTVETGAAGSQAEATLTGTAANPVLNLRIPQGVPGVVQAKYVEVDTLPTASASTMNALYLVPSQVQLGTYDIYYTSQDGRETYSWVFLCGTAIQLSDYATKDELTQLEAKVTDLDEQLNSNGGQNFTAGEVVRANGASYSDSGWGVSDYVPYSSGNAVVWNFGGANSGSYVLQFYNASKEVINNAYWGATGTDGVRTISSSDINTYAPAAAYLRASFHLNTESSITIGSDVAWTPKVYDYGLETRFSQLKDNVEKFEQETTIGDFIFHADTVSGSLYHYALTAGKQYYVRFTLSSEATFAITRRTGSSGTSTVAQVIAPSTTYSAGTHIVPFVCNETAGQYLRIGESADWSLLSDVEYVNQISDVNAVIKAAESLLNYVSPSFTVTGHYINTSGAKNENSSYNLTSAISLPSGKAIICWGAAESGAVAVIAKDNGDSTYSPLVISSASGIKQYRYDNNTGATINVVASFQMRYGYRVYIVDSVETADTDNALGITATQIIISGIPVMGIIGDSLSSGGTPIDDEGTSANVNQYEFAWWQVLKRDGGREIKYFARGGLTTRSWFTEPEGYAKAALPENKCCAYVIALGVNDQWSLGPSYIGSSADIDLVDPTQNADTFYGNYAKIIQLLTAQTPKAKFFAMTVPRRNGNYPAFNAAIREIASMFSNCYLVDLEANYFDVFQSQFVVAHTFGGAHHSAAAYQYIGKIMEKAIGDTITANAADFKFIQFALDED